VKKSFQGGPKVLSGEAADLLERVRGRIIKRAGFCRQRKQSFKTFHRRFVEMKNHQVVLFLPKTTQLQQTPVSLGIDFIDPTEVRN
jgi:hypothetical protein